MACMYMCVYVQRVTTLQRPHGRLRATSALLFPVFLKSAAADKKEARSKQKEKNDCLDLTSEQQKGEEKNATPSKNHEIYLGIEHTHTHHN